MFWRVVSGPHLHSRFFIFSPSLISPIFYILTPIIFSAFRALGKKGIGGQTKRKEKWHCLHLGSCLDVTIGARNDDFWPSYATEKERKDHTNVRR